MYGRVAVRALAYYGEDHGSRPTSSQWLGTRSLSTQQQMGTWSKHWSDKGGEERSWPPYFIKLMAQDKCPLYQALPDVRIVYGTYLYLYVQI